MRFFGYRLFPIAVLALLGIGAYWNSLHAPFVFDDIDSVERNPIVRFATQPYRHSPRSLLFLTFAFNNWLNGQNPFGYHIVNLVLHILNGLIVFAIARRIYNASATGRGRRDSQRAGAPGEGRRSGQILRLSPRGLAAPSSRRRVTPHLTVLPARLPVRFGCVRRRPLWPQ